MRQLLIDFLVYEGSQSKTTTPETVSTPEVPPPSTSPSIKVETKEDKEVPAKTVKVKEEDKTNEGDAAKEEKKETATKDGEEKKDEDDKQTEVNDASKEKEMAGRSIWLKNLKAGTKAMEIKVYDTTY